jgi:hypothetical protein
MINSYNHTFAYVLADMMRWYALASVACRFTRALRLKGLKPVIN